MTRGAIVSRPSFFAVGFRNSAPLRVRRSWRQALPLDGDAATFDHAKKLSGPDALEYVLQNAGASLMRDAVDELLIHQVRSYGIQGQIINTEADNGIPGNVGEVAGGTPPTDTDRDGMSDEREMGRGLDPSTPDDDNDGYTNVEEYLSCLVGQGDCQP